MNFASRIYAKVPVSIVLITFLFEGVCLGQKRLQESPGMLDARLWNFDEERFILNGLWVFFDGQLLSPEQCMRQQGTHISVPTIWNDLRVTGNGQGYGTYYLRILVPDSIHEWSLQVPQLYNSYELWVNGNVIASNGKVGISKDQTIPEWRPQLVSFREMSDTLHLVMQVANFHHHKGGIREPLYLGITDRTSQNFSISMSAVLMEAILLFLEAIAFIFLFFNQGKKKVLLFFALLCMSWGVRVMFSNIYPVTYLFQDFNWSAIVRIEYSTLYFIMIFSLLFINELFSDLSSRLFVSILIVVNLIYFLFTLFTPPVLFTKWLPLFLITAGITLIYGVIITIRALISEKTGVWLLVTSIFLGIILMGYDIIAYEGMFIYNTLVTTIGYLLIFTCITIALLLHVGIIDSGSSNNTLRYKDLYKNN